MADFLNSVSIDKAKALLNSGVSQAQEMMKDPSKITDLLEQIEIKLKEVPVIGESLADVTVMVSMIKSYITREYSEVSPKVIALMVSSLIYLIKKKDIISDNIPVVGIADDMGVLAAALKMCAPELEAYKKWREERKKEKGSL